MLSRLVVQPFLLAMPADVRLAIKVLNNCSEFTWVLLFSKVSAQYIILVKCFPPSLPPSLWRRRLGFVSAVPSSPLRLNLRSDFHQACWQRCRFISLPCEKRFFSCMAFSVYEVIRVACLSRGWFVYNPCLFLTASNQTNYATGKPREWLRKR